MKKNSFALFALLLAAVVLFSFTSVFADGKTTFVVGFDQDFPPYGFVGEDGEFTGYDLEMAAAAAELMGLEVVYQPIAWDSKDMELDSGTIDCIWNGFTINGREDKYEWTEAYKDAGQVILVKADSDIEKLEDLAGKIVAVQTDSSALEALESDDYKDLVAEFKDLLVVAQYNTAFMDLEAGAVDAIAMDLDVANFQIQGKEDQYRILDEMLQAEQYGVGFKLGNTELRDKVQSALEDLVESGKFAEISEKWFQYDSCVLSVCKDTE